MIKVYELAGEVGFWGAETDVRMTKHKNEKSATTIATLEDYLNICKKYNMVPWIEIKMEFIEYEG